MSKRVQFAHSYPDLPSAPPAEAGRTLFYSRGGQLYYRTVDGGEVGPLGHPTPAPGNMVTTDTVQTISGNKDFTGVLSRGGSAVVVTNDSRLSDARTPVAHNHPASQISDSTTVGRSVLTAVDAPTARSAIGAGTSSFSGAYSALTGIPSTFTPAAHTQAASTISDSTTVGRSVLTAADAAAARSAIGAGTSSFSGVYADLTSKPTLGTAAALNHSANGGDAAVGQVVLGSDSRLSNARTPTAHQHPASDLTATGTRDATTFLRGDNVWAAPPAGGTVDRSTLVTTDQSAPRTLRSSLDTDWFAGGGLFDNGYRVYSQGNPVPPLGLSKPAEGIPPSASTFYRGDGTWAVPAAPANTLTTDTNQNVTGPKFFDAGTLFVRDPGGNPVEIQPSTPYWQGRLHAGIGNGEPEWEQQYLSIWGPTGTTTNLTPTNVGTGTARGVLYNATYSLVVNRIYWWGQAVAQSVFRMTVYRVDNGTQLMAPITVDTTTTAGWRTHVLASPIILSSNTSYWICISATATSTAAALRTSVAPGVYPPLPNNTPAWPPHMNPATGNINKFAFCQFVVTNGVMPATMPTPLVPSAWTGTVPMFFFSNA